jgi:hypothetical protein
MRVSNRTIASLKFSDPALFIENEALPRIEWVKFSITHPASLKWFTHKNNTFVREKRKSE